MSALSAVVSFGVSGALIVVTALATGTAPGGSGESCSCFAACDRLQPIDARTGTTRSATSDDRTCTSYLTFSGTAGPRRPKPVTVLGRLFRSGPLRALHV